MERRNITHILFDVDGLLLDTETLYTEATQTLCDEYGKTYTWDIKSKVMGKKESESSKMIVELLGLPITPAEYVEKIHRLYEELFPSVPLLPGAYKLVCHLKKHKVPIAVVSGSSQWSFDLKAQNHKEFFSMFDHFVLSGSDPEVKNGKPAPDAFLIGAARFPDKPDSSKVLVFEDAPNGVEAAHAAGMACVWVPHKEVDKSLVKETPELTLESLEEFKPEMFGLPPYDS